VGGILAHDDRVAALAAGIDVRVRACSGAGRPDPDTGGMRPWLQVGKDGAKGGVLACRACLDVGAGPAQRRGLVVHAQLEDGAGRAGQRSHPEAALVGQLYGRLCAHNLEVADIDLVVDTFCSNEETPQEKLERSDVEEAVRRTIRKIPDKYRDVVMLRIYADMTFSQVAQVLNISENSAKVIYCRAKKMLAEELKNEFEL